jgi:SAM-dependent methyltransferase
LSRVNPLKTRCGYGYGQTVAILGEAGVGNRVVEVRTADSPDAVHSYARASSLLDVPLPARLRLMHDDGCFGERVAAIYDRPDGEEFDSTVIAATVDFLVEYAGPGRALELGIGTGRIALPLAQRGVPVHGIDLSKAMVARLRAKPGGDDIGVTIGDFATTTVDGSFSLAYLVFNTIMNLTTQAAQVACFRNVAAHLEPGAASSSRSASPACSASHPARHAAPTMSARRDGISTSSTWLLRA